MIEKLKTVRIQGRCFSEATEFQFFGESPQKNRLSIVYGKNGSGKSSIATALQKLGSSTDFQTSILDSSGIAITDKLIDKIFVFNEDFIDNNIKIESSGLGTIVLFGEQVELQDRINEIQKNLEKQEHNIEALDEHLINFVSAENQDSPICIMNRIKEKLKSRWAAEEKFIKGSDIKAAVNDTKAREIGSLEFSEKEEELKNKLNENKDLLEKSRSHEKVPDIVIPKVKCSDNLEQGICSLLSQKIDKPSLSERELELISAIKSGHQSRVEDAKQYFSNNQNKICPYCLQEISDEYRDSLIKSINKVLNKDVDNHKENLKSIKLPSFELDLSKYKVLGPDLIDQIQAKIEACNKICNQYQRHIDAKINSIYTPIKVDPLGLHNEVSLLNDLLEELEHKRIQFLEKLKQIKKIKSELHSINQKLAHFEIYDSYQTLLRRENEEKSIKSDIEKQKSQRQTLLAQLNNLEQQKKNVKLAVEQINKSLGYVFCTEKRLKVEYKDSKYHLTSNGQDIKPKDASVGERNVLALCYFFTKIISNQELSNAYAREKLVVIDDPISSTDFDNRIGLLSLLKYQTSKILQGNSGSKLIFFTHDTSVFHNLVKLYPNKEIPQTFWRLENKTLTSLSKEVNEYKYLLTTIFSYANSPTKPADPYIGNYLRRVLEAFITFNYSKGIDTWMGNPDAKEKLGERSNFFLAFMAQIFLNAESHSQLKISSLNDDLNFFQMFSDDDIKNTCRRVLCLMFTLNPDHVSAYLSGDNSGFKKETIDAWMKKIPTNG